LTYTPNQIKHVSLLTQSKSHSYQRLLSLKNRLNHSKDTKESLAAFNQNNGKQSNRVWTNLQWGKPDLSRANVEQSRTGRPTAKWTQDRASNQKSKISTTKSESKNELTHPVAADQILRKSKPRMGGKPCPHTTPVRRSRDLAQNRIHHRKAGEPNPPANGTVAAKEKSGSKLLARKRKRGETEIRSTSSQQNRDEARPSGMEKSWVAKTQP
jgi:hypothetical protein